MEDCCVCLGSFLGDSFPLTARPRALAIGTWEDNRDARAFMETGAFKTLMGKLQAVVVGQPEQAIWNLKYYASK